MRLRARLERLERHSPPSALEDVRTPVEFWIPDNGRGDPPGRYPCPGVNAVLIVYDADKATPPAEADR